LLGPGWFFHPGNVALRQIVMSSAVVTVYVNLNLPDEATPWFAEGVVIALRANGREFYQVDPTSGLWMVAPPDRVHTKILILLRAGAAEELRRRHQVEQRGFLELLLNDSDDIDGWMHMIFDNGNEEEEEEEELACLVNDIDWILPFAGL
jgi:hypothetical protein